MGAPAAGAALAMLLARRLRPELAGPIFDVTDEPASFTWTMSSVRELRERFAREMTDEVKAIASGYGTVTVTGGLVAARV